MTDRKSGFTLIELLVVLAVIALLAALLFPVLAQARVSVRQSVCLSNVKQCALAAILYAQDFDETFPRLDNNGDCWWNEPGCSLPDWQNPGTDPNVPACMFWNVAQTYIKNRQIGWCPEVGKTDWQAVIANPEAIFDPWGIPHWGPYNPLLEDHYYGASAQMAVNLLVIDSIPPSVEYSPALSGHPRSHLAAIVRPAQVVLLVGDSVWDNQVGAGFALGNSMVWPNEPGSPCPDGGQGWTWYSHHPAKGRLGSREAVESGLANVAMCDGHAKAFRHSQLEHCEFAREAGHWAFPYWDPWDPRY
jgi:prepilin-type N-terminal cleavage/methylation domain-containing protein/prepilin-type processing-associated H-X9-DG protein